MTDTITQRTEIENEASTPAWMRLARGSAITLVAWAVLLHLTARVLVPPVLLIGVVYAGLIPFLRGPRRGLGLGYAIISVLTLFGNAPATIDELTHLDSAPAFILTLLAVVAAIVAIVAGFGAWRSTGMPPTGPIVTGATAVFLVLAATSVVVSATTDSDTARSDDVVLVAERVEFGSDAITISANGGGVWIDNKDGIRHTFTIEGEGVDLEIPALKARRVDLNLAVGAYEFICTVPGHDTMKGTLTVSP
jgi:plastocyanin